MTRTHTVPNANAMAFNVCVVLPSLLLAALIFIPHLNHRLCSTRGGGGIGQSEQHRANSSYVGATLQLFHNGPFMRLTIGYGINVGAFYAITTLLDQLVAPRFPGYQLQVGWVRGIQTPHQMLGTPPCVNAPLKVVGVGSFVLKGVGWFAASLLQVGFVIVMTGILGSFFGGLLLDKTGRFFLATNWIYLASTASWVLLAVAISYWSFPGIYAMSGLVGFFMTGLLPVVSPAAGAISDIACVPSTAALAHTDDRLGL